MSATTDNAAPPRAPRLPKWLRHSGLVAGGIIILVILAMALLAPLLGPYDPYDQNLLARIVPPVWYEGGSWDHPLGTDHLGRDYLSRLLYGARISLFIGLAVAFVSGIIGTVLGVTAGYFGGRVDMVISFLITARLALPVILVALAIVALFGSSMTVVVSVLGLLLWDRFALVMRATTQQIRDADFVTAARVQGASNLQILLSRDPAERRDQSHRGGNAGNRASDRTGGSALLPRARRAAAFASWGLMLAEGKSFILFDPWLITLPGLLLFALVLAINLVGDGLRDVTAPDSRN